MLKELGRIDEQTPVVAAVHDCQVVQEKLHPGSTGTLVDCIAMPGGHHKIEWRANRPCGVIWDLLDPKRIQQMPPLQETRAMQRPAPTA
ncbi:MAG TPA: hypothetical protein PLI43_07805 [Albidovulum sp.]|uniref:hypothetical protein n=1 Tax=Albidovulum sp. TaxID=1872424 RepID=UPI002C2F06E0|nr:hypothetical protein [Albidovulum sp.]